MPSTLTILVPHITLLIAACVFLIAGSLTQKKWLWGPLCLAVFLLAAAALAVNGELTNLGGRSMQAVNGSHQVIHDGIAWGMQWMCLGVGGLFTLMAIANGRELRTSSEHFGLLLLIVAAMMLVSVANDLIVLFLALELFSLTIALLLFQQTSRSPATHFILLNLFVSALLLFGFALLYGLTGTTNLSGMHEILTASYTPAKTGMTVPDGSRLGIVSLVLIFAGLGFKLAIVPFHFAVPDLFESLPPWHAGLLAVASKIVGFVAIVRVLVQALAGFEQTAQLTALVLAVLTMSYGHVMALRHTQLRRSFAYLTIGQGGLLMVAVTASLWNADRLSGAVDVRAIANLPDGLQAGLLLLLSYVLATTGLFSVLVYLARRDRQMEYIDDLRGLVRNEPLAAACAAVFLISLAGVPPFAGFWARLFVLTSTLNVHAEISVAPFLIPHAAMLALAMVTAANIVLGAVVPLRIVSTMLLQEQIAQPRPSGGRAALAAAAIAAVATVGLGIAPNSATSFCRTMVTGGSGGRPADVDRRPNPKAASTDKGHSRHK